MKILHTADLHIGRTLEGQSRLPEQRQVLAEICAIIRQEQAELLLIAGDVFDTFNPAAEAEGLFYDFIEQVTAGGGCGVVIIAGNHDQPERLAAANALAAKHSIYILAAPNTVTPVQSGGYNPQVTAAGENWLELTWRTGQKAVVAALPYLSEGRIGQLISRELADAGKSKLDYSQALQNLYQKAGEHFRPDAVNLAMGHLLALGGTSSDSERTIQVGGTLGVGADVFPAGAQYIALGHLHRKQQMQANTPCYYSGSPLACGFGETDQQKYVLLITAEPGQPAQVRELPLQAGYPLHYAQFNSYEQALEWCKNPQNHSCWLNVKIQTPLPLTEPQVKELRALHPRLLRLEIELPETQMQQPVDLKELSNADRFALFAEEKTGTLPQPALIQLFVELTAGDWQAEDGITL